MNMKSIERLVSASCWRTFLIFGLLLTSTACASAQKPASPSPAPPMGKEKDLTINYDRVPPKDPESTPAGGVTANGGVNTFRVASRQMGRDMPYRILLPVDYKNNADVRYPVIYLLHGLTGHFNDWTDRTNLVQLAANYNFIIVTPEGNDGWYSDSPATPNDKYESYIVQELIPEIDRRFRTLADRQHRVIAGLSMGGYGSLKFGLKYPEMFSIVGSFSGALRIAQWSGKAGGNKLIGRSIDAVFGPLNSEARRANDVFKFAREITPDRLAGLPYIYLSCGTEDSMLEGNRELNKVLAEKNVLHDYRTSRGGHDWVFWGKQVHEFLDECNRRLKS